MKRIFLLLLCLIASPALGQVSQSGQVTAGHAVSWTTNGVVQDAGTSASGSLTSLGITASGTPVCINDAASTGPYHQLCFGANSLGGGLVSYNAYGGASPLPLEYNVNGVTSVPLVGTYSGNTTVLATVSGTIPNNHVAVGDTHGNIVDGGVIPAGMITSSPAGELTWYAASGTTVIGNANANMSSGILTLGTVNTVQGGLILDGVTSGSLSITTQAIAGTPTWTAGTSSGTPVVTATAPLAISSTTGNITCTNCVSSSGSLTNNQLVIGGGGQTFGPLGSLGSATTVLHGGAGAPSFGAVNLTTDVSNLLPVASGGTAIASGTAGGVLTFTGSTTISSSGALTSGLPVVGGGTSVPTVGTKSGNNTDFATTTISSANNGDCVSVDANGNLVDAGGPCTTGGGGGTVASGTHFQVAFYTGTGTTVGGSAALTINGGTLTLGTASTTLGTLVDEGSSSGAITFKPQAAAGTYEWDWPITAGSAGQVLTSQGGAGTAMTWTVVGSKWNDTPKTTSFSATANNSYCVDTKTTGAVTVTLPTTPAGGTKEILIDCMHNFASVNMTVAPGGSDTIMGIAASMIDSTNNGNITMIYDATTADWYIGG